VADRLMKDQNLAA